MCNLDSTDNPTCSYINHPSFVDCRLGFQLDSICSENVPIIRRLLPPAAILCLVTDGKLGLLIQYSGGKLRNLVLIDLEGINRVI